MKNAEEIKHWLKDEKSQQEAREQSASNSLKFSRHHPSFKSLRKKMDENPNISGLQLLDFGITAVEELIPDFKETFIDPAIKGLNNSFFYNPIYRAGTSGPYTVILLYRYKGIAINATMCDHHALADYKLSRDANSTIGFDGDFVYSKFLAAGDIHISTWSIERTQMTEKLDKSVKASMDEIIKLKEGDSFIMDGSVKTHIIEYTDKPFVSLSVSVENNAIPLCIEFDRQTKESINFAARADVSSRVQMLATYLRLTNRQDGLSVLKEYFTHADYFVRWHCMREALAINTQAVFNDLVSMAENDPHESIRLIAEKMVAKINEIET